jgi:4-diphosphocytidyl-2-C-methyl-D-erythritol kinase
VNASGTSRPRIWTDSAPAKVNLFLQVLAREEGGYHQLETLFQALALSDRVRVAVGARGEALVPRGVGSGGVEGERAHAVPISLQVDGVPAEALGPPEGNLVVRAARAVLRRAWETGRLSGEEEAVRQGLHLELEKRIPHGAGLGGGSSDAASTLEGVNALLGDPLSLDERVEEGGRLGADVPFFLSGSALALAWGRGDRLLPLPSLPAAGVVLALPPWGIATPEAYGALARLRAEGGMPAPGARVLATAGGGGARGGGAPWSSWGQVADEARNAFEAALLPLHPELDRIRGALEAVGAGLALLSGSGSALFGIFPDDPEVPPEVVEELRDRVKLPGLRILVTATSTGSPEQESPAGEGSSVAGGFTAGPHPGPGQASPPRG